MAAPSLFLARREATPDPVLATRYFQAAVDAAAESGETLVVPPGRYVLTTIYLRSGLTLELAAGAVLSPHPDLDAWPQGSWGHNKDRQPFHFLVADGAENLTVRGGGTIDGGGPLFWGVASHPNAFIPAAARRPSPLVELRRVKDLRLEGITILDSPGWTIHVHDGDRVHIEGITIRNDLRGPNTDGIDLNGVRDVVVRGCRVICGDDAIVLKTTADARSCERVLIEDCEVESGCAALKLGTESHHDFRQVTMRRCQVGPSNRGVAIYMADGGVAEDILIEDVKGVVLGDVAFSRPLHLEVHRRRPDSQLGAIRRLVVRRTDWVTDGRLVVLQNEPDRITDLRIEDLILRYPRWEDPEKYPEEGATHQNLALRPDLRRQRALLLTDLTDGLVRERWQLAEPDEQLVLPPEPEKKRFNGSFEVFGPENWRGGEGPPPWGIM